MLVKQPFKDCSWLEIFTTWLFCKNFLLVKFGLHYMYRYVQYSYQIYVMRQAVRLDTEEYHHERLNELTPNYTGLLLYIWAECSTFFSFHTQLYNIWCIYLNLIKYINQLMENLNYIVFKYTVFQLRDRAKSLLGTCIFINYVPLQ